MLACGRRFQSANTKPTHSPVLRYHFPEASLNMELGSSAHDSSDSPFHLPRCLNVLWAQVKTFLFYKSWHKSERFSGLSFLTDKQTWGPISHTQQPTTIILKVKYHSCLLEKVPLLLTRTCNTIRNK